MTDPGSPGLPKAPPTQTGELASRRSDDAAGAWFLWAALLVVSLVLLVLLVLFRVGFVIQCDVDGGDACTGAVGDVGRIGFGLMLALLPLTVLGTFVMVLRRTSRHDRAWTWPAGGFCLVGGALFVWWVAAQVAAA